MINISEEDLITLKEARRFFPGRGGNGKRVALSTIYRWTQHGCDGVTLEAVKAGEALCTTEAAIQRFIQTLTERSSLRGQVATNADIRRDAEVERQLEAAVL